MKKIIHGGDIYTEGILKGVKILDYSSNINPLGVPNLVRENIDNIFEMVVRYPDIEYRQLKDDIISYNKKNFNIEFERDEIILGNGASEIIDESIKNVKKLLITAPSFLEYQISAKKYKVDITYSNLDDDMQFNYEDIVNKFKYCDGLVITNPNNPNGNIIDKNKFIEILNFAEKNHRLVIIDEAFIEMTKPYNSLISLIKDYECLIIIRAITKFFELPGVRFGYGISRNKKILEVIKGSQLPWNINSFAEFSVKYAFRDEKYIKESKKWIENEPKRFLKKLRNIDIISKVYDTNSNFCLCKLNDIDEDELYDYCLKSGIAIRKCSNFKSLDKSFVRFAIKDKESNDKFVEVLKNYKRMRKT